MDEMFETLTLIQTHKIGKFPLVLVGREYWADLLGQFEEMKKVGTISPGDTDLFFLTDSVEEGMAYIIAQLKETYGRHVISKETKSRWWLGEKTMKEMAQRKKHIIELN